MQCATYLERHTYILTTHFHKVGQRAYVKKIMHITRYETKEYLEGSKIIDIDKASSSEIAQEKSASKESPE